MSEPASLTGLDATLRKRLSSTSSFEPFDLDIHLNASAGVTVLLGPSGSGKTLTMNCIGGFVKPDAGRILLNNDLLFDAAAQVNLPPERRRCGYIFQDHALFPHMTVRENLWFAAQAAMHEKSSGLSRRRQMKDLLEAFELNDLAARKPAQLSGGQKQRAALARIMVSAPRLLLLDEPTRGLDARLREAFYQTLQETRKRLAIPVLFITHDIEECLRVADYIYLVDRGRFLQAGALSSVLEAPGSVEVAKALGIFNLLPAEIVALDPARRTSRLRVHGCEIDGPHLRGHLLGDRGTICFRESETSVEPLEQAAGNPGLRAKITGMNPSPQGVRLQFAENFYCTVPDSHWAWLRECEAVRVTVAPAALYFIG